MADHETPGSKLSARLASRSGLHRQAMEDGGEVHRGPLATRALRAVGARAMTMDETIIVSEDFDPTSAEDQALYAHERLHQMESGGADHPSDMHDAEEVAARAVERMVLHRSAAGESFGSIMRDVASGGGSSATSGGGGGDRSGGGGAGGGPGEAAAAYAALLRTGKSHEQVVEMLARKIVTSLVEGGKMDELRTVPVKGF